MLTPFARPWLLLLGIGCTGTLSSYDRPPNHGDQGTDTATTATASSATGTSTTATGSATGTGGTTGSTTGATGTTTGSTTTTYSGTSTGSGPPTTVPTTNPATTTTAFTLPSAPLDDGIYEGWVHIDYERDLFGPAVPPGANWSSCDGDVTIEVDNSRSPVLLGSFTNCEWPGWDVWAQIWLSDVDGSITGDPGAYGFASGDVIGGDGGDVIVDHSFTAGVVTGPTIAGLWTGSQPLFDSHEGWFVADWVGPLPTPTSTSTYP